MSVRLVVICVLACAACRSGATKVRYAGPPVGQCASGRQYQAPPLGSPTQPLIAFEATSAAKSEPVPDQPAGDVDEDKPAKKSSKKKAKVADEDADDSEDEDKPAKKASKKKSKDADEAEDEDTDEEKPAKKKTKSKSKSKAKPKKKTSKTTKPEETP